MLETCTSAHEESLILTSFVHAARDPLIAELQSDRESDDPDNGLHPELPSFQPSFEQRAHPCYVIEQPLSFAPRDFQVDAVGGAAEELPVALLSVMVLTPLFTSSNYPA